MVNMLELVVLGSSSKGNSTVVFNDKDAVLLDAGLSSKYIFEGLEELEISPDMIKGIFISHEHSDHIRSVAKVSKRLNAPVFTTETTRKLKGEVFSSIADVRQMEPLVALELGSLRIIPFPVPHDAAQTVGFRINYNKKTIALATDIGQLTPLVKDHMKGCNAIVIEANYDKEKLLNGPYPAFLKQRILSQLGHLSNEDCVHTLNKIITPETKHVLLAHLSEHNNDPYIAMNTVKNGLKRNVKVSVAYPARLSERVRV